MKLKDFKAAYRVMVKGLVCDRAGRLLFVRERGETWDLPGGGLEHGEGLHEALRREFREELDAEIEILAGKPLIIPTWHDKFDDPVLILAYEVKLLTNPQATEEAEEFAYFHPNEIATEKLDSTLNAHAGLLS